MFLVLLVLFFVFGVEKPVSSDDFSSWNLETCYNMLWLPKCLGS